MGFVISFSFHVYISMLIVEARDEHCAVDRSRLVVPQYLVWPICFSFEMEVVGPPNTTTRWSRANSGRYLDGEFMGTVLVQSVFFDAPIDKTKPRNELTNKQTINDN